MDQYTPPPGNGPQGGPPGGYGVSGGGGPPRQGPPFPPSGPGVPWGYPPPPPPGRFTPPYGYGPASGGPQVVHVVARSGGFKSALMWVLAMLLFGGVFVLGIVIGVSVMIASSSFETIVLREHYREGLFATNTVAVIPIEGVITRPTAEFVRAAVDEVIEDRSVRAVVLRVDSPGGEVAASDEIWYQIERLKNSGYQVVASYGGVAASGGYYVSCGANHIIAEPTCITGSIGVIAQVLTLEQLFEKIGVEPVTLVANQSPEKDVANNIYRSWTEADRAKLGKVLDAAYATFRKRVESGRSAVITDAGRLNEIADGSIFTADEALTNGLIDGVGYLDDAIAQAEQLAGLATGSAGVFFLREPPSLFGDGLLGEARQQLSSKRAAPEIDGEQVRKLLYELSSPRPAYLMH